MRTLSIDIETYSSVDIKKSGSYPYIESPDFDILLFSYAFDDEPVTCIDLLLGETIPERVIAALCDADIRKTAHNAQFERTCISKYLGITLDVRQWQCTMMHAAMVGLPLSLDAVAKVLKLPQEKMSTGKALIRYFCIPCKPTKANGMRTRNLPGHDTEKWQEFKRYNVQDVVVEREIKKKIAFYNIPDSEMCLWYLDQAINDKGILLDPSFINNAINIDALYRERLTKEAIEITGLNNPNSVDQLKKWISAETGINVGSLTKESTTELAVHPLLSECENKDIVRRVLEIRQEMSKTSVKKYLAMTKAACADERLRGLVQFYGANRTGRWAGRLVQVQNLPRIGMNDYDLARRVVCDGDGELLEMLYGNVPDTLSQLIRTAFIAPQGSRLIVADFSAIEARVIAWLAGERWRLDVFNTHGKIYETSASQMFKIPIERIVKGNPEYDLRQKGKVAELACIAAGQLVLTDKGLVPIEFITIEHQVWDGNSFVSHGGVIFKGCKKVITYGGLTATPDHLVWVNGSPKPIQFANAAASGARLLLTGNGRNGVRLVEDNQCGETLEKGMERSQSANRMHRLSKTEVVNLLQSVARKEPWLSNLFTTEEVPTMVRPKTYRCKAKMYKSKRPQLSQLRRAGDSIQVRVDPCCRFMDLGQSWYPGKGIRVGSYRQRRSLRSRQPAFRITGRKSSKPQVFKEAGVVATYDIINAGPNNRFTVSNVLVHNCGYQGGPNALITMGALKMGIPEEELPKLVAMWRNANKAIVNLWYEVGNAAINAVESGTTVSIKHGISFFVEKGVLFIQLPSGRRLSYLRPKLKLNRFGEMGLTYEGMNQTTKQWGVQDTYGGKLVENIVQAVARDCLAVAMLRLDAAGYNIVAHVHDEVISEMEDGHGSTEEVNAIMGQPIPWAQGLPLSAESYETLYYKKD